MELLTGVSLDELWKRQNRRLPVSATLEITSQVLDVLAAAHARSIVHRDIKPANVFVLHDGTVKILDFGIARVRDTTAGDSHATGTGVVLGTPAYMAPELLAGATATAQCDLYALGVLLFELLVGRRPFESDSMGDLLARIARQAPPPLRALRPDLPQLLEDIVARLLSKRPEHRHTSGRRLAIELRMAQQQCAAAPSDEPAWADTEPFDRLEDAEPVRRAAARTPGEPVPHKGVRGAPGQAAIQGTIDNNVSSAQRSLRRTLPSS
jgi:serine/threonine-protein kinase